MAVRVEWRTLADGDVVEQRAVWEGSMQEAIEEWQNRPQPTKIADAVDAWRERDTTKYAARHGWGTRRRVTRISEAVDRWRGRGEGHPWTDFEGIGGTVFRGVTVIGGTAVEGMSVVGSGTVVATTVLGGKTLGTPGPEAAVVTGKPGEGVVVVRGEGDDACEGCEEGGGDGGGYECCGGADGGVKGWQRMRGWGGNC